MLYKAVWSGLIDKEACYCLEWSANNAFEIIVGTDQGRWHS